MLDVCQQQQEAVTAFGQLCNIAVHVALVGNRKCVDSTQMSHICKADGACHLTQAVISKILVTCLYQDRFGCVSKIAVAQTETLYYGDRKISIRTSVLEEKATACNMLCCYADELEVGFFPYVEQVLLHTQRS